MQGVESNPDVKSIVLVSAKPGCWIAGADIKYGITTFTLINMNFSVQPLDNGHQRDGAECLYYGGVHG